MPIEVRSREEFLRVVERAEECRVKESTRRIEGDGGSKRVRVLKIKARTKRYLYTIVFENVDEGIEFAKSIKDKCKSMVIVDSHLQGRI